MKVLRSRIHPTVQKSIDQINQSKTEKRLATRAIALDKNQILLMYTERYDDYSLPGGGVDDQEELSSAFKRELIEETGAKNISNICGFGIYEEYRNSRDPHFDIQYMVSYCYTCTVDKTLGENKLESYEKNNGMRPVWIDLDQAIIHNENIIKNSPKSGLSIERELFLLKLIKESI